MLKGKTALVTGSTSGIGLGLARALAAEGVNIMVNGFGNEDEIDAICAELAGSHGVQVMYNGADVTDTEQVAQMCEDAFEMTGAIDILINNAGIQHVAPIQDFPEEKWDAIIATNLTSAFHTTKACLPGMRRNKWGRVINIASAHGLVASPFKSAYVAAKHGIVGFTKSIALETARDGVTVNAICPGYVRTPLVDKQIGDQAKARGIPEAEVIEKVILDPHATKEFVSIEGIAGLVLYLCSDAAASITGASLPIDGGWTAR